MPASHLGANNFRETWLFLILGTIEPPQPTTSPEPATGEDVWFWEVAVGNADELVDVTAARSDSTAIQSKHDLLDALHRELDTYRHQDSILITPTESTVTTLRQEILTHTPDASLRGFTHIPLQELLTTYFNQQLSDHDIGIESWSPPHLADSTGEEHVHAETIEDFWQVWTKIFTLIPATELQGTPL